MPIVIPYVPPPPIHGHACGPPLTATDVVIVLVGVVLLVMASPFLMHAAFRWFSWVERTFFKGDL